MCHEKCARRELLRGVGVGLYYASLRHRTGGCHTAVIVQRPMKHQSRSCGNATTHRSISRLQRDHSVADEGLLYKRSRWHRRQPRRGSSITARSKACSERSAAWIMPRKEPPKAKASLPPGRRRRRVTRATPATRASRPDACAHQLEPAHQTLLRAFLDRWWSPLSGGA